MNSLLKEPAARRPLPHAHPDHKIETHAAPKPAARLDGSARHAVRCAQTLHPHHHARNKAADFAARMPCWSPTVPPRPSVPAPSPRGSQTLSRTGQNFPHPPDLQAKPPFIKFPGQADIANERDRIDKTHGRPVTHGVFSGAGTVMAHFWSLPACLAFSRHAVISPPPVS